MSHVLYKKSSERGCPDTILDANGDVVLALCRVCGQAEADLAPTCPGEIFVARIAALARAGLYCFEFTNTREYVKDILETCTGERT